MYKSVKTVLMLLFALCSFPAVWSLGFFIWIVERRPLIWACPQVSAQREACFNFRETRIALSQFRVSRRWREFRSSSLVLCDEKKNFSTQSRAFRRELFRNKFVAGLWNWNFSQQTVNFYLIIIPSQMEVAPLHCTVDIIQKRRLFKNTKEIEKM